MFYIYVKKSVVFTLVQFSRVKFPVPITMSEDHDIVMLTGNFTSYMRKYDERPSGRARCI